LKKMKTVLVTLVLMVGMVASVFAADCKDLPTASALQTQLIAAPGTFGPPVIGTHGGPVGGLFEGSRMWAAIVNRDGELCSFVTSTSDPTQVWPGSQAIAKAKAYTANAFSLDSLALSSAMLYTFTQPGHSLWSLGQSNLFNPEFLAAPGEKGGGGSNKIAGGLIFFGGGVPLYKNGKIVGGLGVSGDTSCADHEIAKRTRDLLGLNPPGGATVDDIHYTAANGADNFTHPLCIHTWRNSIFVGEEPPAAGY
jgi:uncharacterized protein GlcG (DUF336 family)